MKWAPSSTRGTARILIDGKKPSEFPGAYRISRPQPGPWSPLFLARVDHDAPLQLESWTLKVTSVTPDPKNAQTWAFEVTGSITGNDGSGASDKPFVSTSGRVKIDPAAWFRGGHLPLYPGYTIRWNVAPMFVDSYANAKVEDPAKENATTVIQGIPNGPHTLELIADNPAKPLAIKLIRTYRPPLSGD